MTGIMKAQIDWIPLAMGSVRPTQGKTLAVMQVSGGSQIVQRRQPTPRAWALDANVYDPQSIFGRKGL